MLKQSYYYLLLQLTSVIVGLFVTFYIARNVGPDTFALYAVSMIVTTLYVTFTFLGFETILIRNLLHWKEIGKNKKIKNYVSYALFSRLIMSLLLFLPVSIYLYFISYNKYEGEHVLLFLFYMMSGVFSAINNANGLILKSLNLYIIAFTITTVSSVVGRLIATYLFIQYGFEAFISTILLMPVFSSFISAFFFKEYIDFNNIRLKYFFKFKKFKYFIFSGYSNYLKNSIDQLLVSIFLTAEILAVYNLARRIEEIGRSFVVGFFEPLSQRLVKHKANKTTFKNHERKIFKIRNISIFIVSIITVVFCLSTEWIIRNLGLEKYTDLNVYMIISSWTCFLYILYKVESHIIYLFEDAKVLFSIDILVSFVSVLSSLVVFYFMPKELLYCSRLFFGFSLFLLYWIFYAKKFKRPLN